MMQKESIPCGPLCTVDEACQNPSILQREMLVEIDQPGAGKLKITGNPIKLSQTLRILSSRAAAGPGYPGSPAGYIWFQRYTDLQVERGEHCLSQ